MGNLEKELLDIRDEIKSSEQEKAEKEGLYKGLLQQLKTQFEIDNVESIDAMKKRIQEGIEKHDSTLEECLTRLRDLGWEIDHDE